MSRDLSAPPESRANECSCTHVYEQNAGIEVAVRAELPDECWVSRDVVIRCTDFVGGTFSNGQEWTRAMCCLPCRIRSVLPTPPDASGDS